MRKQLVFALAGLLLTFSGPASTHEFWIDPLPALPLDAGIATDLRIGQFFKGDVFPYLSDGIVHQTATVRGETFAIKGIEGDLPAINIAQAKPGLNVLTFFGKPNKVVFDDYLKFATYLETEGLEWVIAAHQKRGLPHTGFTEAFSRTVKSLVQVGPVGAADADARVGMPFELVASANPYANPAARSLEVTLYWNGKPAPDTQIAIFQDAGQPTAMRSTVRTDAAGKAAIDLAGGGRFLLNAVHMREAAPELNAVWESHWASLTFALPR